jgi:hypothetical protein
MLSVGQTLWSAPSPVYIFYQTARGSCDGVHAMFDGPPSPLAGTANYYDPAAVQALGGFSAPTCDIDNDTFPDVGISDVFAGSCSDFSGAGRDQLPSNVGEFFGPVQVMTFVVPTVSTQRVISRDAAYLIYGFGGNSNTVSPWTVPANILQRTSASGTQSMIAKAIGVPPANWRGNGVLNKDMTAAGGSGDMITALQTQAGRGAGEVTIGIVGADLADVNRSTITVLAYQHTNQKCAYFPDSTSTAFDKINVRDGHYPIWGPLHLFVNVDGNGTPTETGVATFVNYVAPEGPTVGSLQAQIDAGDVPHCAMRIKRTAEMGPYLAYEPSKPCGCFFEKRKGGGADCVACGDSMPCGAGQVCSYGYCEAM